VLAIVLGGCYTGLGSGGRGDDAASGAGSDAGEGVSEGDASGGADTGEPGDVDDSGRITLHRLNRAEYNNTIRDLFWGLEVSPADNFPADDHSYGFDNIADVLSVTPLLFELYERGTDGILDLALTSTGGGATQHAEAEDGTADIGQASGGFWALTSAGAVTTQFTVETDGDYTLRVRAYGQQGGPDLPLMQLEVDGVAQGMPIEVDAVVATPGTYELDVALVAGSRAISARFTNDFYDADAGLDSNLYIDWIEIESAGGVGGATDVRAKLLVCEPAAGEEAECTREVLDAFVQRAWRRPVTTAELDGLVALAESARADGDSWEDSLRHGLKGVLISSNFVFRVETDPDPTDPTAHPLGDYELASRLSYFLWSSMPDDELFAAAKAGTLHEPEQIEAQVMRMLDDERAQALVANFAGQWLYSRAVEPGIVKDATFFPNYDAELLTSMRTEMEMFFSSFVTEDRSLRELLTANDSFVDARLAALYGLPAPEGEGFGPVSLEGAHRRGVLTMAGLMTVLSHPDQTSPVKRGKWVLDQLLCTPPPPPPAGVQNNPPSVDPNVSVREQLEMHRQDPKCAACHDLLDPLGLSLEHYDAIGGYRTVDGGKPVDASGNLPDGTQFGDALELAGLLAMDDDFTKCTVRHSFTYALGRGVTDSDQPYLDEILVAADADGFTLRDLALAIATSEPFRMRRGEEG
jgi:Protein of unknown function (DUF1592)/Protein of unknown function (DUF1588)/Protein of unknown function (DUF1587)/Protein of unknown function (DUF1585)/Protein of unknown function (DUF1595)/Ca-dependent carbohydrate-binding module xylan-binding